MESHPVDLTNDATGEIAQRRAPLANLTQVDFACISGFFLFSLILGWYLTLAYPYGFWNGETPSYEALANKFRWFAPNPMDWWRTVPFALLLSAAKNFHNPSITIYWVNTLLFSISSALVFVLGREIFFSRILGVVLALIALVFEFANMRIFFCDLHISADPLFAQLIYLGVLLALIGWLRRCWPVFVCGYAVLGLATFTKPIGMALLPIWVPVAILSIKRWPGDWLKRATIVLASALLLVAPLSFWSLRNLYVYGYAKSGAAGGILLLMDVLPLLANNDRLFDDNKINAEFIYVVRKCERDSAIVFGPDLPTHKRLQIFESYLRWGPGPSGPFEYLASLDGPNRKEWLFAYRYDSHRMFKIDQQALHIAKSIIFAHPMAYASRCLREYMDMFNPLAQATGVTEFFQSDPKTPYQVLKFGTPDFILYPGSGHPIADESNQEAGAQIGSLILNPCVQVFLKCYYAIQSLIVHLIFLVAVIWLVRNLIRGAKGDRVAEENRIPVVWILLFLTVCLNYAMVALCQVAKMRYALAGDPELHLMVLIAVIELSRRIVKRFSQQRQA